MAGTTAKGGYLVPNIEAVAHSVGFSYYQMDEYNMDKYILLSDGYALIDYQIEGLTTVSPKLEFNKPIDMPLPLLSEEEYSQINEKLIGK